jgi:hypothetical protein
MGQPIPQQHPAVVLRSHYTHLRALLAIAMACVVSLTIAVVILAGNDGTRAPSAADPAPTEFRVPSHARVHGGAPVPELHAAPQMYGPRYDGGPEEGTRGR